MALKLPTGYGIGNVVEVAWDVEATEKRSGHIVYEGYFDARIIALDGPLCKLHFDYNPPDGVYDGPMEEDIVVNLDTGIDDVYDGVVFDIRRPIRKTS
jgi:hypothetical protein